MGNKHLFVVQGTASVCRSVGFSGPRAPGLVDSRSQGQTTPPTFFISNQNQAKWGTWGTFVQVRHLLRHLLRHLICQKWRQNTENAAIWLVDNKRSGTSLRGRNAEIWLVNNNLIIYLMEDDWQHVRRKHTWSEILQSDWLIIRGLSTSLK